MKPSDVFKQRKAASARILSSTCLNCQKPLSPERSGDLAAYCNVGCYRDFTLRYRVAKAKLRDTVDAEMHQYSLQRLKSKHTR